MRRYRSIILRIVCVLGAVGSLAAAPDPERADFPVLWNTARLLAGTAFLLGFLGSVGSERARRAFVLSGCVSAVLALFAALGRCENLHLSPMSGATSHFFGIPSVLFFLAMAWTRDVVGFGGKSRAFFLLSVSGAVAALFSPFNEFASIPIFSALARPNSSLGLALVGLTLLGCSVSVLAGWKIFFTSRRFRKDAGQVAEPVPSHWSKGLWIAPIALVLGHLSAFLAAPEAHAFFPGVMLAALILYLTLVGSEEPELWKKMVSDIPRAAKKISAFLPPVVLSALYALVMTQSAQPIASDENIYFYMAKETAEGAVPYRDFFFAHPPLKILLLAPLFKLFGFSLALAKLVSPLIGVATGFALWALCRRYFGALAAFLAMAFFLFSYNCLNSTAFLSGVELTTFFMVAGVLLSLRGKGWSAGVLFGAAALTGVYAAAGICAALVLGFFRRARFAWIQLAAFAGIFLAGNLACWSVGGGAFVKGVYTYHGLKPFFDARMRSLPGDPLGFVSALANNLKVVYTSRVYLDELMFQPGLWMALAAAPIIFLAPFLSRSLLWAVPMSLLKGIPADRMESVAFPLWWIASAFAVQYAMFREQYGHYFLLIYPFLAALLGHQIARGFQCLEEYADSRQVRAMRLGLFCLVSASLAAPLGMGISRNARTGGLPGPPIVQYEWRGGSGNSRLDEWVKALFWQPEWILDRPVPGYRSYLRNRAAFPEAVPMAEFIKKNSSEGETLTGGSNIAPLLALLSGRKLAAREIDTNGKRFLTEMLEERRFWEAVCADKVRYVVCDWNSHFTPAMMNTVATPKAWFHLVASGDELAGTPSREYPVLLYERNGGGDAASPCAWVAP